MIMNGKFFVCLIVNFMFILANIMLFYASKGMILYNKKYINSLKDDFGIIHLPYYYYIKLSDKSFKLYLLFCNAFLVIFIVLFNVGWIFANYFLLFLWKQ